MFKIPLFSILFFISTAFAYAQVITNSGLPILKIDIDSIDIPLDEKIAVPLQVAYNPNGLNSSNEPFTHYNQMVGIEYRGSSSLFFPKKGFSLELRDAEDEDLNFPLLGMPEEEDWVLHGPYSDKTLIRNAFVYALAGKTSVWAPKSRLCHVYLKDNYQGVYLLIEKVKRDKKRLNISKLGKRDNSGTELTGGFLLKIDKNTADNNQYDNDFVLPLVDQDFGIRSRYLYEYPKSRDITQNQKEYIKNWMTEFEFKLVAADFRDPELGYRPYIDLNSWYDFLLVNEVSRNVDGYRISTFLHKKRDDKGGKLHMGPVWDFNLALGNANYCEGSLTTGWAFKFNDICANDSYNIPFHWNRLLQDSFFVNGLNRRWRELRANQWSDEAIFALYDSLANQAAQPAQHNFERWPVLGEYIWPNAYIENSHQDAVDHTRNWLVERLNWLDAQLPELVTSVYYADNPAFKIYPNPTSDYVFIKGFGQDKYPLLLEVFGPTGKKVQEQQINAVTDTLSVKGKGLVVIRITTANGEIYQKNHLISE